MRVRRAALAAALLFSLAGCGGSLQDWMPPVTVVDATPTVAPTSAPPPEPPGRAATVDHVADGDTVDVKSGPGGEVRILGINSPETKDPRKPVECWGPESSAWAKEQLPVGSEIRLVSDPTQDSVDRYGRELAYVLYRPSGSNEWLDFSVESARLGMSKSYVYKKPVEKNEDILAAENEARQAKRGLWNCPENAG